MRLSLIASEKLADVGRLPARMLEMGLVTTSRTLPMAASSALVEPARLSVAGPAQPAGRPA